MSLKNSNHVDRLGMREEPLSHSFLCPPHLLPMARAITQPQTFISHQSLFTLWKWLIERQEDSSARSEHLKYTHTQCSVALSTALIMALGEVGPPKVSGGGSGGDASAD